VQYAYAWAHPVVRLAQSEMPNIEATTTAPLDRVIDPDELSLAKLLAGRPRLVESAAVAHVPYRIAFDRYDVAGAFHGPWNKGKDDASLRFLIAIDAALTAARPALVQATATIVVCGLEIMGVTPVEEMR
jgi:arginyl-tRNA synthetase